MGGCGPAQIPSVSFPSRVAHLWRYTDPQWFINGDTDLPRTGVQERAPWSAFLTEELDARELAGAACLRDGFTAQIVLDAEAVQRGLRILNLSDGAGELPGLVEQHLGILVGSEFGKFEAQANALWTSGVLVFVPRGVKLERPVHLLCAPQSVEHRIHRLLVVMEEDSALELIDEYGTLDDPTAEIAHATAIVELFVGPGARLSYIPVQNWGRATVSYLTQRARLGADARLETVLVSTGSKIAKLDAGAILAGRGAQSNFFGLAIGDHNRHFDHHTVHDHQAGNTASNLHFKIALKDKANSVYTGLIRIADAAPNCEAYQENRNLLLSAGARAQSIPELEILNKDVRCTHGATVGKIDPKEVFYLSSRGIDPHEAVKLIVAGFVAPIVERVPDVARERLRGLLFDRLQGM